VLINVIIKFYRSQVIKLLILAFFVYVLEFSYTVLVYYDIEYIQNV
jgi:hypothetical protein